MCPCFPVPVKGKFFVSHCLTFRDTHPRISKKIWISCQVSFWILVFGTPLVLSNFGWILWLKLWLDLIGTCHPKAPWPGSSAGSHHHQAGTCCEWQEPSRWRQTLSVIFGWKIRFLLTPGLPSPRHCRHQPCPGRSLLNVKARKVFSHKFCHQGVPRPPQFSDRCWFFSIATDGWGGFGPNSFKLRDPQQHCKQMLKQSLWVSLEWNWRILMQEKTCTVKDEWRQKNLHSDDKIHMWFSEFLSPMPWKLGKTTKTTSRFSGRRFDGHRRAREDVWWVFAVKERPKLPSSFGCLDVFGGSKYHLAVGKSLLRTLDSTCPHFFVGDWRWGREYYVATMATMKSKCRFVCFARFTCVLSWGEVLRQMAFDVVHIAIRVMPASLVWICHEWLPDVPRYRD